MLVKGPVIEELLYAEPRPYGDSDILVRRSDWNPAICILLRQGFRDALAPMAHPRMESFASTAFVRGSDNVDLHCTLAGLEAPPEEVWEALWESADAQEIGGTVVAVPGRPAVLMHLALHAVHHHADEKPLEDLRRGIAGGAVADWRLAAELADRLGGAAAFASGLRRLPEGEKLATTLGVERIGSLHFELRTAGVPTAEGLHELFAPGLTSGSAGFDRARGTVPQAELHALVDSVGPPGRARTDRLLSAPLGLACDQRTPRRDRAPPGPPAPRRRR